MYLIFAMSIINHKRCGVIAAITLCLLCGGCATDWQRQSSYFKTIQTELILESQPSGKVYINNNYVGLTNLKVPLEYGQEVQIKTRKVSYWETEPGWSLFISILSLGLYLPFSFIPVDADTSIELLQSYKDNTFKVEIHVENYPKWTQEVVVKGQREMFLKAVMEQ